MSKRKFKVSVTLRGWYVVIDGTSKYLYNDGIIRDWEKAKKTTNEKVWHKSKLAAERALAKYQNKQARPKLSASARKKVDDIVDKASKAIADLKAALKELFPNG